MDRIRIRRAYPALIAVALTSGCASKSSSDSSSGMGGAGFWVPPVDGSSGRQGGAGGASGTGVRDAGISAPHHFSIVFDYRFDTAGFFDLKRPERRRSLEAAAALWSRVIQNDFPTVPAGTKLILKNPENRDGPYVTVDGIEHDIDDVVIFVGTSASIAPAYGRSSPAATAVPTDSSLVPALEARITGSPFRPWAGSVTFHPSPSAPWYYDRTPETSDDIPQDSYDFQSFAVHELGHVLGFTTESAAYKAFISGSSGDASFVTFTGPKAASVYGGAVRFETDGVHLATGTVSGGARALMNLTIANGAREGPTPLDEAILSDLGYEFGP